MQTMTNGVTIIHFARERHRGQPFPGCADATRLVDTESPTVAALEAARLNDDPVSADAETSSDDFDDQTKDATKKLALHQGHRGARGTVTDAALRPVTPNHIELSEQFREGMSYVIRNDDI